MLSGTEDLFASRDRLEGQITSLVGGLLLLVAALISGLVLRRRRAGAVMFMPPGICALMILAFGSEDFAWLAFLVLALPTLLAAMAASILGMGEP